MRACVYACGRREGGREGGREEERPAGALAGGHDGAGAQEDRDAVIQGRVDRHGGPPRVGDALAALALRTEEASQQALPLGRRSASLGSLVQAGLERVPGLGLGCGFVFVLGVRLSGHAKPSAKTVKHSIKEAQAQQAATTAARSHHAEPAGR